MRLAAFALFLLIALGAHAQAWYGRSNCTGPEITGVDATNRVAYYCLSGTSTTDSNLLASAACGSVTVQHMKTSSSDLSTAYVRTCDGDRQVASTGKSYCQPILMDSDGGGIDDEVMNGDAGNDVDGDGTKENRGIMWGFGPIDNIYIDTVLAPDTGQTTRFKVTCHGAR